MNMGIAFPLIKIPEGIIKLPLINYTKSAYTHIQAK
jgi:hypothetical protein